MSRDRECEGPATGLSPFIDVEADVEDVAVATT
jgi:hypothetical protein